MPAARLLFFPLTGDHSALLSREQNQTSVRRVHSQRRHGKRLRSWLLATHCPPPTALHGSLEGVGGLKTNEAYHSKADALLIPKMYFFLKIYLRPFLEMLVL